MGTPVNIKPIDTSTPGANSNTYSMFNSVTTFGGGLLQVRGVSRLEFSVANDQAGTLKFYFSTDKGTTWTQVGGSITVNAKASTDINGPYDFLCDPFSDVKLDWVNGGSAQGTWIPAISMVIGDRAAAV